MMPAAHQPRRSLHHHHHHHHKHNKKILHVLINTMTTLLLLPALASCFVLPITKVSRSSFAALSSATSSSTGTAAAAAAAPPTTPFIKEEDVAVWQVPPALRRPEPLPGSSAEPYYVEFLSLAKIFAAHDGEKLADLFDSSREFRHAIRVAMRDDLFIPDPTRSEKVNRFLKDLGSSLHVNWERSPTDYSNLSRVFQEFGIQRGLDGKIFIKTLGALAGGGARVEDQDGGGVELHENRFGSLIDIVNPGNRLKPAHSWHQDCNLPQITVMLGFPKTDYYKGTGVFSHAIKISHQLRDQVAGGGAVVQYDEFEGVGKNEDLPTTLPESIILRPWYEKGREVMVYDDCWHIHSAPDHIHRTSTWRFM